MSGRIFTAEGDWVADTWRVVRDSIETGRGAPLIGAVRAALLRPPNDEARVRPDRPEPGTHGHALRGTQGERAAVELFVLPLPLYLAHPQPAHVGVWLAPMDDAAELKPFIGMLQAIAIDFPQFTDGRGYSTAALLRRFGFRGELRAIGDVLVDQIFFLKRVGFTSFALRPGQDPHVAQRVLSTYSASYQAAYDPALPAFRRLRREAANQTVSTP